MTTQLIGRLTAVMLALCAAAGSLASCATSWDDSSMSREEALDYANEQAHFAYRGIMEYASSKQQHEDIPINDTVLEFFGKELEFTGKPYPVDMGEANIHKWVNGEGCVIVLEYRADGKRYFAIHWRSSPDSDIIGQYPQPITEDRASEVVWDEFLPITPQ